MEIEVNDMKKILIILILLVGGFFFFQAEQEVLIPQEAIRFRVIANSDSSRDQEVKQIVSRALETQISSHLKGIYDIEEARRVFQDNLPVFQDIVEETLASCDEEVDFQIHYGMNPFPEKVYNGVTYKEGEYESLVVTLGEGLGKNWWCVLFPPICLLEAEETTETDTVEYKFFVKELIDKYF